MSKHNVLWWIIGLLVALNLSTVATILYRNSQLEVRERTVVVETATGAAMMNRQYLCKILQLCDVQKCEFCPKHKAFRRKASEIVENIDQHKRAMFEKMHNSEKNIAEIEQLATEIGLLHAELKRLTAQFYLDVEKICDTQEQKDKLKTIFQPLFEDGAAMSK